MGREPILLIYKMLCVQWGTASQTTLVISGPGNIHKCPNQVSLMLAVDTCATPLMVLPDPNEVLHSSIHCLVSAE